MKRDIKIRYAKITEIIEELSTYKKALDDMDTAIHNIHEKINNSTGEAIDELKKNCVDAFKDMSAAKDEINDLLTLFKGYKEEMTAIIKPLNENEITRVSRNDIWWNIDAIAGAVDSVKASNFGYAGYDVYDTAEVDEAEQAKRNRNKRKLEEIKNNIIPFYEAKLQEEKEKLWAIHNNKVIPYENKDDEYAEKARQLYNKHTGFFEGI